MDRPIPTERDLIPQLLKVYVDIHNERIAAHAKHAASGRSIEQLPYSAPDFLPILGEEFGEVCTEVLGPFRSARGSIRLRAELVQVAAVATAWIVAIDHG